MEDYIEIALEAIEHSQGDVRDEQHKQWLTQIAMAYAAIAQAQALVKIAGELEEIKLTLGHMTDGTPILV